MTQKIIDFDNFSPVVRKLYHFMSPCILCPRKCGVDRIAGEKGYCAVGPEPRVSSASSHFGEESILVGRGGSGTIFFAGCNLGCIFCQNYRVSHQCIGDEITVHQLADTMLDLQVRGCENINLVSPTHQIPPIAAAIEDAHKRGLTLPIVYNSGGYDCANTLSLLEGLIDIYMPDMKYSNVQHGLQYSDVGDYPGINYSAVKEMYRQVGDLQVENGIALKGLIVRHLVLPHDLAGSTAIIDFLASQVSPHAAINIMDQYYPAYHAGEYEELCTSPQADEIAKVKEYAHKKGLRIID
ncbi:anaerobic ribonucleoside-triphosphate reductase activating protein [Anaerohalosphaera lusitana]|uniref:Anaerobic ribonucleoside-triphosphate reductase activating protein n=1 Tax=Anaerohalosphaera lusitana TaxID=1936003 RepID=A0A1U9NGB2_9BACT|nr:hypothetical protein [Anaerohalosphaera lusitana]AQT66969.1 anaerobic ribonucleoside-triphosphate reductase activating protein [Anaerohalosphaera lusitana]